MNTLATRLELQSWHPGVSVKTKKDEIQMKEARVPLTSHHGQKRLATFDGASVAFALL